MRQIVLNGEEFTSKENFHNLIKKQLGFPEYYGNNLDALWDSLTTDMELPIEIYWTNFNKSREQLGKYALVALDIFERAAEESEGQLIFNCIA